MTFQGARHYFMIDGDRIGDRLELALLDGDLVGAARFSAAVTDAIELVAATIVSQGGAVVFKGGDEVFGSSGSAISFRELQVNFHRLTGCSLSIGLGDTPQAALQHLRRAKLLGGDRIVGDHQVGNSGNG